MLCSASSAGRTREGKLKHLGLAGTPKRSTLAYASEHRPWRLYETLFQQLLAKCQGFVAAQGDGKKFRFKNWLLILDATVVDLCVSRYD